MVLITYQLLLINAVIKNRIFNITVSTILQQKKKCKRYFWICV